MVYKNKDRFERLSIGRQDTQLNSAFTGILGARLPNVAGWMEPTLQVGPLVHHVSLSGHGPR